MSARLRSASKGRSWSGHRGAASSRFEVSCVFDEVNAFTLRFVESAHDHLGEQSHQHAHHAGHRGELALPDLGLGGARVAPLCAEVVVARGALRERAVVDPAGPAPGFTGTGFVNYNNVVGSAVEFTTYTSRAGTHDLVFRYANGTTSVRTLQLLVNGAVVGSVAFGSTGSWSNWQTAVKTLSLTAGTALIKTLDG